mmetsp:Transcript_7027/g.13283  ORF Transcript_7027/g.13283 Transcript_7027/m.13283 type:complete len:273 (-) Transcript_7027:117-935(-)
MDYSSIRATMAYVLCRLCVVNDTKPLFPNKFIGREVPNINIKDYLDRIQLYSECSEECFVFALVYIDRLIYHNKKISLNSWTVHRLLLTAILVAAKFHDDVFLSNKYFSVIGGIKQDELAKLEMEFVFLLNFDLHLSPEVFQQYMKQLTIHSSSAHTVPKTFPPAEVAMETAASEAAIETPELSSLHSSLSSESSPLSDQTSSLPFVLAQGLQTGIGLPFGSANAMLLDSSIGDDNALTKSTCNAISTPNSLLAEKSNIPRTTENVTVNLFG